MLTWLEIIWILAWILIWNSMVMDMDCSCMDLNLASNNMDINMESKSMDSMEGNSMDINAN